jgi:hypothetical protein
MILPTKPKIMTITKNYDPNQAKSFASNKREPHNYPSPAPEIKPKPAIVHDNFKCF